MLNGEFAGEVIDIDFAGGKDIDFDEIFGIALPLAIADATMVLTGTGAGALDHALVIHGRSDIRDIQGATGVVLTTSADVTIKSDSRIKFDAGTTLTATAPPAFPCWPRTPASRSQKARPRSTSPCRRQKKAARALA